MQSLLPKDGTPIVIDRMVIFLGELAFLVAPLIILRQRNLKIRDVIPLHAVSPMTFFMAFIIVIGTIGVVSIYEVLVLPFFPMPDFLVQFERELAQGGALSLGILIFAGSVVAPLVEEVIFRGILQQSLFYRYGSILPAILIPTVIFALFHVAYLFYLPAFVELLALAILLGWLMVKTGNILIPILVHALFNLSSFSAMLFPSTEEIETLADIGLPWIVISILFMLGGWLYFKFRPVVTQEDVYLIEPMMDEE
jgi:membrane protease YdiL (CAAX protease family)